MPTRLVALDDGPDIPLGREPIVVGRHPLCDVRLPSIRVSRRHCCLTEVDGEVAVRDLGSSNGTRINDRRVEAGRLRPGDTLTIANLRYRLEKGRVAESSRAAPQAASRAESASLRDLPGPSLFPKS
jgi:pSer/pThr/pTyr-binding forkhead associated (FHA) protein